jgi:MFS transporter, CP family, cyanate transporter
MSRSRALVPAPGGAAPTPSAGPRWTLVAAIVLTALNLRTAVTSVGPLLAEVQAGTGLSSELAGVLTTLPVACFALVGWYAPALAARLGEHRAVAAALGLMTVGLAGRAAVGAPLPFLALSGVALVGGAVGNVLLPSLVKRHFPDRIGTMTAVYTTVLAVGLTAAAAGAVPIAEAVGRGGWRVGLGAWALLSAVAVLPWLLHLRDDDGAGALGTARGGGRVLRSRTAWALALAFGTQSLHAYVAFGWFALYYREQGGFSASEAGLLVAVIAGLSIPVSAVVPSVAARLRSQWPLVLLHTACYVVAYTGMLLAPAAGAWVWAVLVGIASGSFPLVLTMIALRTRTADVTASLSAFTQSLGYGLAGGGPLLVGVLHDAEGEWTGTFVLLFVTLAAFLVAGCIAARPRVVEDELRARSGD